MNEYEYLSGLELHLTSASGLSGELVSAAFACGAGLLLALSASRFAGCLLFRASALVTLTPRIRLRSSSGISWNIALRSAFA